MESQTKKFIFDFVRYDIRDNTLCNLLGISTKSIYTDTRSNLIKNRPYSGSVRNSATREHKEIPKFKHSYFNPKFSIKKYKSTPKNSEFLNSSVFENEKKKKSEYRTKKLNFFLVIKPKKLTEQKSRKNCIRNQSLQASSIDEFNKFQQNFSVKIHEPINKKETEIKTREKPKEILYSSKISGWNDEMEFD